MFVGQIQLPNLCAHVQLLRILGIPMCRTYSFGNLHLQYQGNLRWTFSGLPDEVEELLSTAGQEGHFVIKGDIRGG
jgi:hypothetical protein